MCHVPLGGLRPLVTLWVSDVHRVPSSAAQLSSWRLSLWILLWGHCISYLVFLFSCWFLFFSPELLSFWNNQPSPDVPEVGQWQFCQFCLQQWFRLNLLWDPLVHFSDVSVSVELSPTPYFKRIHFFPISLLHCSILVHCNWEYKGVDDLSLGSDDTSLLLMVFPNYLCFITALLRLLASWLQSPFELMTEPK